MYVAYKMEEPREGNRPSLRIVLVVNNHLIPSQAVRMFTGSGSLICTSTGCSSGLKGPIDLVPRSPVVLPVPKTNIIGPPCRLHEQHEAMIGSRNVLHPRLPLVRVPGMFIQHCFYLVDTLRVLLPKDLISDGSRELMAGNVSWSGGWFFLMAAEIFNVGSRDCRLPGLGALLTNGRQRK